MGPGTRGLATSAGAAVMASAPTAAVVGVDMGTQTTKVQVVALDGRPLSAANVATRLHQPNPTVAEQDPAELERGVLDAIRAAVAQAPDDVDVHAVGVDGQMGGALAVDAAFAPLTPYESWLDTRADDDRSRILDLHGANILSAGGIIPFVGPRVMLWLRENPNLARRIAKVLAPTGFITGRLTGARADQATCDRTQAHLFGCFDVPAGRWHTGLTSAVGLREEWLPHVVDPLDIVGGLTPEAAAHCGLPSGIPVAAGLGDGTAGWVAAGAFTPGSCVDTGGSSEHFAVTVGRFAPDPYPGTLLTCMPSAMPGRFHLFGFTAGTGLTRRWWTDLAARGDYAALDAEAVDVAPRMDAVLAIPHLFGMLTPFDPHMRAAFVGCDGSTTAAEMYRALAEAMAFEFRTWIDHATALVPDGSRPRYAVAIGGAAQSAVNARIKADVLGIPYVRMQPHVNAARGAAIAAAAAIGDRALDSSAWQDEGRDVLDRYVPDTAVAEVYSERSARYRRLVAAMRPLYDAWATGAPRREG